MLKNSQHVYKIECVLAPIDLKPTIKNLARFYVYEFSRYTGEDFPKDGLFEAFETSFNFDKYWDNKNYYPFIFHVDNQLAGFALINKKGSSVDIDWYLAEFYIVAKFQNKGIGRHIAMHLFAQFSGVWEVMQIPNNIPALSFWRKIIQQLTGGQYTETLTQIQTPHPHQMIVHKFQNKEHTTDTSLIKTQSN
ncbi:MAG: GNAT family N-acetyltransferase [Gammaproteobacteria bacterium]|nr:GNAT family N-acetyltransferase [Gammaproteobacteria bacterium]